MFRMGGDNYAHIHDDHHIVQEEVGGESSHRNKSVRITQYINDEKSRNTK